MLEAMARSRNLDQQYIVVYVKSAVISSYLSRELYPRVRLMSHWQSLKTRHKVVKIRFEDYPILGQTPQNRI